MTARGRARYRKATPLWRIAQLRFDEVYGKSNSEELRATLSAIARHERLRTLRD
jgi:hypothetical protein